MPETKSDCDANSCAEPPDKDGDDASEFVEVDPTGRYGRYDDVLGKGAFKTVYRAFDEVDGIEVAWNQVKVQDVLQSPEDLERLYSEVHLLKTLKHKNIIKFYNSWVDTKTKNVNFITEIFTSGTLRQYRKRHKHVDIKAVKNWSRQILRGLLYLHSHDPPIIHRDLKCDNIFVNGNQGEVKIGDLGLAAILRQAHAAHSVIGTPEFMAPELYEEEYNELVDIYSFGMCLLEMVTFEYPYSECTNAAQIYKKVTSGKKPAALEKVKDPEVRGFVEKCLATASRRLPARELLTDPFLQCEGDREAVDCVPCISLPKMRADDMEELGVIPENHNAVAIPGETATPQTVEDEHAQGAGSRQEEKGTASASRPNSGMSTGGRAESEDDYGHTHNQIRTGKYTKEEQPRRSRDFRVKGKRRDDDAIFLRLRIADPEGHIRNIHFPFDVEADTPMSVATEMVAELDLSDQDVTTIAEMIDAEILVLVPEWKSGVAVDDTGIGDGEICLPSDEGCGNAHDGSDVLATMSSEGSILDQLPSSRKARSHSPRGSSTAIGSPPRVEGTMHGRFEEITYLSRGENSRRGSEAPPVFSSDSSGDCHEGDDWDLGGRPSTMKSGVSVADSGSPAHQTTYSSATRDASHSETYHSESSAFNELVEMRRKAGTAKFSPEAWDGMTEHSQCFDRGDQPLSPGEEEAVTHELELLELTQQQEVRDLQWRHEQALLAIKNRHHNKAGYVDHKGHHTLASPIGSHHDQIQKSHSLDCLSPPHSKRSFQSENGKLPLGNEESEMPGHLSPHNSAPLPSSIRFVATPKAYGLGHNLQGHVIVQPSPGKSSLQASRSSVIKGGALKSGEEIKYIEEAMKPQVANEIGVTIDHEREQFQSPMN